MHHIFPFNFCCVIAGATIAGVVFCLGSPAGWTQQAGTSSTDRSTGKPTPPAQSSPAKPPPLEVDLDEPLRLDVSAKPSDATRPETAKPLADNGACFVCHANFRKEALAFSHASNGVGCVSCHGASTRHRNDEANVIPPDIMFPAETLDASCGRCHEGHDVKPSLVVERFLERTSRDTELKSLVCTSCHGAHRLAVRTVRWDKKTGKLVARGGK